MLKLNVGLSRKVGEANYGSRGASVHLELEVESALAGDTHTLQERIRALFRLARTSVDEELAGHGSPNHAPAACNGHHAETASNGHGNNGNGHGNGSSRTASRPATVSQIRAIHAIANRRQLNLPQELQSRYGHRFVEQLSLAEASQLIDAFKALEQAADY